MARNVGLGERHGPGRVINSAKRIHAAYILIAFPLRTLLGGVCQYANVKNQPRCGIIVTDLRYSGRAMHRQLLPILAVLLLAACGQSEPPTKGRPGPPVHLALPVRQALPDPRARQVPPPALPDRRSRLSQGLVINPPALRGAKRTSRLSTPTRSIPEVSSRSLTNGTSPSDRTSGPQFSCSRAPVDKPNYWSFARETSGPGSPPSAGRKLGPNFGPKLGNTGQNKTELDVLAIAASADKT